MSISYATSIYAINTHNILTVNNWSPRRQSLLDDELLRHSLVDSATISVVHKSTCHDQQARSEATNNATCDCPYALCGRRGLYKDNAHFKSGCNVMEKGGEHTDRLADIVATLVGMLATGDAKVPFPRPRHCVTSAATILKV